MDFNRTFVPTQKDKIQAAEMRFLSKVKGRFTLDRMRNANIAAELNVCSIEVKGAQ